MGSTPGQAGGSYGFRKATGQLGGGKMFYRGRLNVRSAYPAQDVTRQKGAEGWKRVLGKHCSVLALILYFSMAFLEERWDTHLCAVHGFCFGCRTRWGKALPLKPSTSWLLVTFHCSKPTLGTTSSVQWDSASKPGGPGLPWTWSGWEY